MKQTARMILVLSIFMTNSFTGMNQTNPHVPKDSALLGTHWTLVSVAGLDLPKTAREAFIVFDGEKQAAYGSSGCNRMTGKFTLSGNKLTIGPMAGTRMACDEASMKLEQYFHKVLGEVDGYEVKGNTLLLKKGNLVAASFVKS